MRSAFKRQTTRYASTKLLQDETYDLKGLNTVSPDQVMPAGESPYTINARMYAKNDGESRVAIRTRKGSIIQSTPVGETAGVQNVAGSTGDIALTGNLWITQPFVATTTGVLTKIEAEIKKAAGATGIILVRIYSNNAGFPGTLIGSTSVPASSVGTSYAYLGARLMDAPTITSGTTYHMAYKVQDGGTGTYYLNQTAASGAYSSPDLFNYTALNVTYRYKTYTSTAGSIKGFTRRYASDGSRKTLFALGTNVYSLPDSPAVPTSIYSGIDVNATAVRFDQVDDKTIFVDGFGPAKQYDGTTVSTLSGVAGNPTHVKIWQNRAFFIPANDPNRVNFSELYDFTNYPAVNFFYVPTPKSPDHITGWRVFQDNLTIFTHETKHIIYGQDISTFTRKEAVGTKGAVSDEAIAVDRNSIFFMADDHQIYEWNGSTDRVISNKVETVLQGITNTDTVRLHVYNNQLRVYFAKTPSTYADTMLLYDIDAKEWMMDSGRYVVGSLEWTQDNNELLEFSSRAGITYFGENGFSDVGKPINFKYWTAYKSYGSGTSKKRVKSFRPYVRPVDSEFYMYVGKDIDFKDSPDMRPWLVSSSGAKWGSFSWGDGTLWGGSSLIDNKSGLSGRGKHIQYRFEKEGVDTPVELYGYAAWIKEGAPK